jgi:hypothetical protein
VSRILRPATLCALAGFVGLVEVRKEKVMNWERDAVDRSLVPPLRQKYVVFLSSWRMRYSVGWETVSMVWDLTQWEMRLVGIRDEDMAGSFSGEDVEIGAHSSHFEDPNKDNWVEKTMAGQYMGCEGEAEEAVADLRLWCCRVSHCPGRHEMDRVHGKGQRHGKGCLHCHPLGERQVVWLKTLKVGGKSCHVHPLGSK